MWFKNLHIYQIPNSFKMTADELAEKLEQRRFKSCGRMIDKTIGWVSPIHHSKEYLIHSAGGCILFCMRKEQKVLPASAVKEALEEKISLMEGDLSRKIYSKEKQNIKEDIVSMMLPNAFAKSSHVHAYFDMNKKQLMINASSATQVDEFYELLIETIGSFSAMQLVAEENPASIMSQWVLNTPPQDWLLSGEYLLKEPKEERVARFKDNDSENQYVAELLADGYLISRLGLHFKGQVQFVLQDELQIKSIKFNHELLKENDELAKDDEILRFDADFALMTASLAELVDALKSQFKITSSS